MILLTAILLIFGEAIPEALALRNKTIAGIIEGIYRVVVTLAGVGRTNTLVLNP